MKIQLDDTGGVYVGDSIYVTAEADTNGLVTLTIDAPSRLPITPATAFQDARSSFDLLHSVQYVPLCSEMIN